MKLQGISITKNNGNFSGIHELDLLSTVSRSNWNLEMLVMWREENWSTRRKTLGAGTRTNNKLNPHVMPTPGIKLGHIGGR